MIFRLVERNSKIYAEGWYCEVVRLKIQGYIESEDDFSLGLY